MDLKPSNIVINTNNEAIIIDISGIATRHSSILEQNNHYSLQKIRLMKSTISLRLYGRRSAYNDKGQCTWQLTWSLTLRWGLWITSVKTAMMISRRLWNCNVSRSAYYFGCLCFGAWTAGLIMAANVHSLSKIACNDVDEICVFGMLKCAGITILLSGSILLVRHPPFNSRSFSSFQSKFHHFCLIQSRLYGGCRTRRIDPDRRVEIPAHSNIPNTHISPTFITGN